MLKSKFEILLNSFLKSHIKAHKITVKIINELFFHPGAESIIRLPCLSLILTRPEAYRVSDVPSL